MQRNALVDLVVAAAWDTELRGKTRLAMRVGGYIFGQVEHHLILYDIQPQEHPTIVQEMMEQRHYWRNVEWDTGPLAALLHNICDKMGPDHSYPHPHGPRREHV